jgi:tetratricopeptide (TPR) repeat protein
VSDNTNKSGNPRVALEVTRALPEDEVESAKILMREGLVEEAKKTLYRVLANHPSALSAKKFLKQIQDLEIKALFQQPAKNNPERTVDPNQVCERLEQDFGLNELEPVGTKELWCHPEGQDWTLTEQMDVAIAFFEMDCFADALRELNAMERRIRIEQTFLGETGIAVVALIAQCLIALGRAFEAKSRLEPIMTEADLRHEDKLTLYYCMGLCEESLGSKILALGWYQKISQTDLDFRDVRIRIQMIQ